MTDKQIIIDGVDVSRCIYYKTGDCLISPVWCDQFYNCYYKHLQRVDERNKTLEDVEEFRLEELATLDDLREENDKLKQTLADIKEVAEICKCHNDDGCYECKYFDDCEVEDEEIPTRDVCKLILQKISEVENE